ncbi:MAG: hypothetical protein LBS31_11605 [Candidatus Adiutrix sp.]|jgi:hypothetical protein|nr:hypothetical protein [Candidatus Adiutrix sp.]
MTGKTYALNTPYGELRGIVSPELHPNGQLAGCRVTEINRLATPAGLLTPRWALTSPRIKESRSIFFYPDGSLKRLALQERSPVATPLPDLPPIPAELVCWHADGALKRLYPLNGKISAYWSENDEGELAYALRRELPCGVVDNRIVSLFFYPGGALKGLSLWPGETAALRRPGQPPLTARIGFTMFEDGELRSFEPAFPQLVRTPLGPAPAYDPEAVGVHGETPSVVFSAAGQAVSLRCPYAFVLTGKDGTTRRFQPGKRVDPLNEARFSPTSLALSFSDGAVTITTETAAQTFPLDAVASLKTISLPLAGARRPGV